MRTRTTIAAIACSWLPLWAGAGENPAPAEPAAARESAVSSAGAKKAWTKALRVAHQLAASQDYRRRETSWDDVLPPGEFAVVPLQLYAGNQYFVIVATDADADDLISAAAFDPHRKLIKSAPDESGGKLVLTITPQKSGPHYIRLRNKGDARAPLHCSLTYIYR